MAHVQNSYSNRYPTDVLAAPAAPRVLSTEVEATPGLVVEDVESQWCGAIVRTEHIGSVHVVVLEDRRGRRKSFELGPGFWLDGKPVTLVRPRAVPKKQTGPARSASGSRVVEAHSARVARASRIWVEGTHDAELVEKIWGHDLRVEGVVVEPLHGVDDLGSFIRSFQPSSDKRLGILVDHLVEGSKETRIAREAVKGLPGAKYVEIVGHPYVDVWQAVKPKVVGLREWPAVPRSMEFKDGLLQALGMPYGTTAARAKGWKHILGKVRHYADLEPSFLGRMEQLIDFVTQ